MDSVNKHRRSIRLPGWDYRSSAAYFITICTFNRQSLFDNPVWSRIAEDAWQSVPQHNNATLDNWVLMPDHFHGIIFLGASASSPLAIDPIELHWVSQEASTPRPLTNAPAGSLGAVVRSFKAVVTRKINVSRGTPAEKVWQRGYYERIIRDNEELERIRGYIAQNPVRWAEKEDSLNRLLTRMRLKG